MAQYVVIGEDSYRIDTEAQVEEALAAMHAAEIESLPVYAGEPDGLGESYRNGRVLLAEPVTARALWNDRTAGDAFAQRAAEIYRAEGGSEGDAVARAAAILRDASSGEPMSARAVARHMLNEDRP
jgi:hypothetical protein